MEFKKRYEYNPQTDLIGRGGSSMVFKGYDNNLKRVVAIKRSSTSDSRYKNVLKEITDYCQLKHPNIIQYYDYFEEVILDSYGGAQSIEFGIMEFANSGEFTQVISKSIAVNLPEFKELLIGIINGLDYLHGNNEWKQIVIHRDLKPGNILLNKTENNLIPKICDFGISKTLSGEETNATDTVKLSTPEYRAPEQIDIVKYGVNGQILANVDFWSLGCIVYEYFKGYSPFGKRTQGLLLEDIEKNILDIQPDYSGIPEPYKSFVKKCLIKNANLRVQSTSELKEILEPVDNNTNNKLTYPLFTFFKNNKIIQKLNISKYLILAVFLFLFIGFVILKFNLFNFYKNHDDKSAIIESTQKYNRIRFTNNLGDSYVFIGEIKDGVPYGHGIASYTNGNRFEGDFINGLREGKGIYYFSNGSRFDGMFKNNSPVGEGTYFDKNDKIIKKGRFIEGELHF